MHQPSHRLKTALTIAGSDSSGGAGIQADLKTFQALGVYGMSAITAVTVQNTQKVFAIQQIEPRIVHDQIVCLFEDMPVDAVKIGMVSSVELIDAIARALNAVRRPPVVLDPVMISKSGYALLEPQIAIPKGFTPVFWACGVTPQMAALVAKLFPLAEVVTPNIHEAEALLGDTITSIEDMQRAAASIRRLGAAKVVVKGGHLAGDEAVDILYDGLTFHRLAAARLQTTNTHGTGCTFSSAIAAGLAKGEAFYEAVYKAKHYITGAISHALDIGRGHGPTHHFFDLYSKAGMDDQ